MGKEGYKVKSLEKKGDDSSEMSLDSRCATPELTNTLNTRSGKSSRQPYLFQNNVSKSQRPNSELNLNLSFPENV